MAKKHPWRPGDVFLVPLRDGSFGQGQVVIAAERAMNSVVCVFSSARHNESTGAVYLPALGNSIAILFVTRDLLDSGRWMVVCNLPNVWGADQIHFRELEKNGFVGVRIIGSGIVENFLNAYHRLEPWDDFHDPNYLDALLLSPELKPKSVILTRSDCSKPDGL